LTLNIVFYFFITQISFYRQKMKQIYFLPQKML
jgi:hypothetical protein